MKEKPITNFSLQKYKNFFEKKPFWAENLRKKKHTVFANKFCVLGHLTYPPWISLSKQGPVPMSHRTFKSFSVQIYFKI